MSILNESLWKDIPNFKNYQAHPEGEVRNKKTKRIMSSECKKHRYISLLCNGKSIAKHKLIALTFHPNPNNLKEVNHKDGNKRNNKADNLEWISHSDNVKDAIERGRKPPVKHPSASKVKITLANGETKQYNSHLEAEKDLKLRLHHISGCLRNSGGFYYGPSTSGWKQRGGKDNWLWKVEPIVENELDKNIIEKPITIKGFTHLIARSDGSILNKQRRQVGSGNDKYIRIKSLKNSGAPSTSVHRLIAHTFIPNPENKEYVNHIDGNTFNNCVSNLEWCTQKENMQHAIQTGLINSETTKQRGDKNKRPIYQLEFDGTIIKKWDGASDTYELSSSYSDIASVCSSYKNVKQKRHIHAGYGWCYVSDYNGPKINKSFTDLFPEITNFENINFDAIRKYVKLGTRPLWQIDLDGKRIKLWESPKNVIENMKVNGANLNLSYQKKKTLCGGYFWQLASYDDIINPTNTYIKNIPVIVKNALKIDDDTVYIKPEIIKLIRENISTDGKFNIKTRPILQLNLDDTIVRTWSGPSIACNTLGYGRNTIEGCLYGKANTSQGYKWRYLTLEEIIIK